MSITGYKYIIPGTDKWVLIVVAIDGSMAHISGCEELAIECPELSVVNMLQHGDNYICDYTIRWNRVPGGTRPEDFVIHKGDKLLTYKYYPDVYPSPSILSESVSGLPPITIVPTHNRNKEVWVYGSALVLTLGVWWYRQHRRKI